MRELRFRMWDLEYEQMEYDIDNMVALKHGVLTDEHGKSVLMQFTGLIDLNGRRIYEGDILKRNDFLLIVEQKGQRWAYVIEDHSWSDIFEADEVIGNIYENKDLLSADFSTKEVINSNDLQVKEELKTFELSPKKSSMIALEGSSHDICCEKCGIPKNRHSYYPKTNHDFYTTFAQDSTKNETENKQ